MHNNTQIQIHTSSLNLASYLLVRGAELYGKEKNTANPRQVIFHVGGDPCLEKAKSDFLYGYGGKVDVHKFLEAQKRLKNFIHEQS